MSAKSKLHHRRGTNLTEVVIATLIVGLMLVPAMNNVGAALRSRAASASLHDGQGLAQGLMTEVLQQLYEDPDVAGQPIQTDTGEGTSTRIDWDDVDDYDTWSKSPPQDKNGNALAGYSGWTRAVIVDWVDPNNPTTVVGSDQGLKKVTVTVTSPTGLQTTLVALRSSVGVMEQVPLTSCPVDYLTWADCELQVGSNSDATVSGGVNLVNHAEVP